VVEWDVEVIWRPFFTPKWDVSASKPDEVPAEWKGFFRAAVNLTMPKQGTKIWTRIGAAWPNKSGKGSRWRVGKKAFTIPIHTEKDMIAEAG
jgi:hypothetical protein